MNFDASQHAKDGRAREQDFRLLIDTIPGFVWTMTAAGEVETVNRQMLDYFSADGPV